jgi:glycosyltransferase involved in cell wall biosynthesis
MNYLNTPDRINVALVDGQLNFGGAERQLYELAIRLDKSRFNPVVFCLSEADYPFGKMLREKGIKVYTLKRRGHFDPFRVIKLVQLFRKEKINIVHSFLHVPNAYSYVACQIAGIDKFIASVRSLEISRPFLFKLIDRWALRGSAFVITNSKKGNDFVKDSFSIDGDKIKTIYNGIDLKKIEMDNSSIRKELGIDKKSKIISMIAKATWAKNIRLFLEIAEQITRHYSDVKFLLIGKNLTRNYVKKRFGISAEQNVFMLGERKDIINILNGTDIFVLTSRTEGLPNVIMEAMGASKPVVATNVGGIPELVVDGETGYLVPSNNVEKLSQAVIRLLENPRIAKKIGETGRKRIEELFSVDRMVKETENLYLVFYKNRINI